MNMLTRFSILSRFCRLVLFKNSMLDRTLEKIALVILSFRLMPIQCMRPRRCMVLWKLTLPKLAQQTCQNQNVTRNVSQSWCIFILWYYNNTITQQYSMLINHLVFIRLFTCWGDIRNWRAPSRNSSKDCYWSVKYFYLWLLCSCTSLRNAQMCSQGWQELRTWF